MGDKPVTRQQVILVFAVIFIAFGTVAILIGTIGHGPDPDANRVSLIAGASILPVAVLTFLLALRSQLKRSRNENFDAKAAQGTLNLRGIEPTTTLVALSSALADRFQARVAANDPPLNWAQFTVGDLVQLLLAKLRSDAGDGRRCVQPAALERVRNALRVPGAMTTPLGLDQSLARSIPTSARHDAWHRLETSIGAKLPRLGVERIPRWIAFATALALTYAILIAIMSYLDRTLPLHDPPILARIAGKVLVRGGFLFVLAFLVSGLVSLARTFWPAFPKGCTTVAELAVWVHHNTTTPGDPGTWAQEDVWTEVRQVVAKTLRLPESAVTQRSRLAELIVQPGSMKSTS